MIYKLIRFILLLLPYWLVINIYKSNKSLPANIKTRTGKVLKAIMITEKYGILFTEKDYIKNRVQYLRKQQNQINQVSAEIANEMNNLSMEARELFFEDQEK